MPTVPEEPSSETAPPSSRPTAAPAVEEPVNVADSKVVAASTDAPAVEDALVMDAAASPSPATEDSVEIASAPAVASAAVSPDVVTVGEDAAASSPAAADEPIAAPPSEEQAVAAYGGVADASGASSASEVVTNLGSF